MKSLNKATITLSKYINSVRKFLLSQGFFEHHLYSTLNYKLENTDTFEIEKGRYLRYNPEPDIWQAGREYDKFFWIGSMFRNEKKITDIHKKEFTVVDIYFNNGNMKEVVKFFIEIISEVERDIGLEPLSKLPVKYVSHYCFNNQEFQENERFWAIVTDYPKDESFYDGTKENGKTNKFEIFLVNGTEKIEIAACGLLGNNYNENMFVNGKSRQVDECIMNKRFAGFGFGVERIIGLYKKL